MRGQARAGRLRLLPGRPRDHRGKRGRLRLRPGGNRRACCSPTPTSTTAAGCPCSTSAASAAKSSRPPPRASWRGWCCSTARGCNEEEAERRNRHRQRTGAGAAGRGAVLPWSTPWPRSNSFGRAAAYDRPLTVAPGITRDVHRRRPHPRLGEHRAGAGRGGHQAPRGVLRRHRQRRPAAAASADAAAAVRRGRHGDRPTATATAPLVRRVGRGVLRGDRGRLSPAAATS